VQAIPEKSYEEDLHRLELLMRQLKVKYDQFFAGAMDRQPFELRAQAEQIIKRITRQPPGKFATRFHFNALVSRYNSFSELWNKTLRSKEEGDQRSAAFTDRFDIRERLLTRCLVSDPDRNREELRRVHTRFAEARARAGKAEIPFDRFSRNIASQTKMLRAKHGCASIEVRLVENDRGVQIKARPGR